jgi:hypothetical protein
VNAVARFDLPDWPRLMSVELAACYLGIGKTTLEEKGPAPKSIGRRVVYDRNDLDRWADALSGQPLGEVEIAQESKQVERNWRERRRKRQGD